MSHNNMEEEFYNVEKILDKRYDNKTKRSKYFIKWEGYNMTQNTWEPEENLETIPEMLKTFNAKFQQTQKKDKAETQEKLQQLAAKQRKRKMREEQVKVDSMQAGKLANKCLDKIYEDEASVAKSPVKKLKKDMLKLVANSKAYVQQPPMPPAKRLFEGYSPPAHDLAVDVIQKVLGCNEQGGKIVFSVLFRSRADGVRPKIGLVSFRTLKTEAPELFMKFLYDNVEEIPNPLTSD